MKRFLTVFLTCAALAAALCVSASASSFDGAAEELAGIGVFRGTAAGFELDRAPTRSEAAIMLVRLYGAEEAAAAAYEAGEIQHPFADVSDFAAPYVAWLYANGIANGVSASEFGSARACTAQNYTVFLLRALGYQDGRDFQYAGAAAFAAGKGLLDLSGGEFLRDDLAAMTYQALACDLRDGGTYLLDSLVRSGAVDKAAAKPITDKIEACRALSAMNQETSMDVDFTMSMGLQADVSTAAGGMSAHESMEVSASGSGSAQVVLEGDDMQMGMRMSIQIPSLELEEEAGVWMRDGWMYLSADGERYKQSMSDSMSGFLALSQEMMDALNPGASAAMLLPFIDSIAIESSGQDTVYTMSMNKALSGLMGELMDAVMAETESLSLSLELSRITYTYTVGGDGRLKAVRAVMKMDMGMDAEQDGSSLSVAVGIDADVDMTVNAMGGDVRVAYPADLDSYPELI